MDRLDRQFGDAEAAISHVRNCGVAIFDSGIETADSLVRTVAKIASTLGEPYGGRKSTPIEFLTPVQPIQAHQKSLSAQYGKGIFPWHTDTAHRTVPSRWVIMACKSPGSTAVSTEVVSWDSIRFPTELARRCSITPFAFVNGSQSFLSTIVQTGRKFVRFDPGCMKPTDSAGQELLSWLSDWAPERGASSCVEWVPGRVLLLDNWAHLHRRLDATDSVGRTLVRAYAA